MAQLTAAEFFSCGSLATSEVQSIDSGSSAPCTVLSAEVVPMQTNVGYAEGASKALSSMSAGVSAGIGTESTHMIQ
jgi:hypothetical protein